MKTKHVYLTLISVLLSIFMVSVILYSYSKTDTDNSSNNIFSELIIKDEIDEDFTYDPDFIKFWDIYANTWINFSEIPLDTICHYAENQDTIGLFNKLGLTETQGQALADTIEAVVSRMFERYSELKDMADTTDCYCGGLGNSPLNLEPICDYMAFLETNNYTNDLPDYFSDQLTSIRVGGDPPQWAVCLLLCSYNCLPLSYFWPAYLACVAACEALCALTPD